MVTIDDHINRIQDYIEKMENHPDFKGVVFSVQSKKANNEIDHKGNLQTSDTYLYRNSDDNFAIGLSAHLHKEVQASHYNKKTPKKNK